MIQDIWPEHLDNAYRDLAPEGGDSVISFCGDRITARHEGGRLLFPERREIPGSAECVYAFSAAGRSWFLALGSQPVPDGFGSMTLHELRELPLTGNLDIFLAYTAFHLWKWYGGNRFCGACGSRTELAHDERALTCPRCGNRIYPRINPAVIVGVVDGEYLLITRYKSGFRHNALIAGFTEIGETPEQTAAREVMEEVGIRVKNIRYYQSQPWGIASDLLMGFYCEPDGDRTIRRDDSELGSAEWVRREEIILQPSDHSLTNAMMKRFRDGKPGMAP